MKTHQFIRKNKANILNMDGNLDEATITLKLEGGKIAFYWFKEGRYERHIIKE
jgi:hypothetical protein